MERYNYYTETGSVTNMLLYQSGQWVRYDDAAARIAELEAEIVERRKDYSACIRDQHARIADLEQQLAAAQERNAELEVELDIERDLTNKALDKLAELATNPEDQLAAEREANRWIPVSERLPECTLHVVACQTPFSPFVACYVPGEGTWYDDDGIELDFIPTHWRELPAPPQEAADDHK